MDQATRSQTNLQFLSGGGEMGRLTREKDWSKTAVGDPEHWPQSLRTTLSIILNSKFPMFLFWGPELICFYNDAYRPSLGNEGKHPTILGGRAEDFWKEIWKDIKPIIDHVLAGGEANWSEDQLLPIYRNGKMEDVYWTFSYSPVNDESGRPAGVFVTCTETTDKVITLKKLEESNQRYLNNIIQAPVAMAILRGKDHIVEIANDLMLEIWGKPAEAVLNKPIFEGLPEAKGQGIESLLDAVFTTGEKFMASERPVNLPRGNKIESTYINFVYEALRDADGAISGIIAIASEVTLQVVARQKIEEGTEKLNIVIEASDLGTWELDLETSEVRYSKRYLQILGEYAEDTELTHAQLIQHLHPDDLPIREKAFKEALVTGFLHYESRIIWQDKSIHWGEARGKVFYNKENKPVKLMGTLNDITKEKKREQELSESEAKFRTLSSSLEKQVQERTSELIQSNESLKKSEERYHLMVEEVQDYAILYLNREGIVENWNKGAEKIKGYKTSEIVGESFSVFYTDEDRENGLPQQLLALAEQTGRAGQEGWRVRKDGTRFWASVVITAVHNEAHEVIGFSKVTHDLTEKKKASDELKRSARELKQKNNDLEKMNQELESFAYISSHDLQEPLRKIQTFSTQIMEKEIDRLSESGKDKFLRMQKAAKRMQKLIEDLLTYSRTNSAERNFEKINLHQLLEEVKEELKEELNQKNATIEAVVVCDLKIIPFQFRQLLLNLISNSLKFIVDKRLPYIKISSETGMGSEFGNEDLSKKKKYCHIRISDNGIGFDQKYNKKIFEVFQRLHGKNEYGGTGIGLAIVKKIVENHHGVITAHGVVDQGASFDIYIPEG